jgi:hypothetical protein
MPLLDEYYDSLKTQPHDKAKKILFAVMRDLLDRKGFRHIWDETGDDIKEEILESNLKNIQEQSV